MCSECKYRLCVPTPHALIARKYSHMADVRIQTFIEKRKTSTCKKLLQLINGSLSFGSFTDLFLKSELPDPLN